MSLLKKIKKLPLLSGLISLLTLPAYSANGLIATTESIFITLGDSTQTNRSPFTFVYAIKGFSELHENWRISYGISGNYLNGVLLSLPISLAYVPTSDYKENLRPQIFAGIEPFYSTISDKNFTGFKFYGNVGVSLDYIFDNKWIINAGTKFYINDSFFRQDSKEEQFNTGVLSLFGGVGIKL